MRRTRWCSTTAVSSSTSAPPAFYASTTTAAAILTCSKCFSSSHSDCVVSPTNTLHLPPLHQPRRRHIQIGNPGKRRRQEGGVGQRSGEHAIGRRKIASTSINNAGVSALKADAERKAKEEALARRRAYEAAGGGGGRRGWVYYREKVERERDIVPPRDRNSGVGSIGNAERVDDSHQSVMAYIASKLIEKGRIIA